MNQLGYAFPFVFIGMFIVISYVLSRRGWTDLVNKYSFEGSFDGQRFGIISAVINGVNYNRSLTLRYNHQGFFLRPVFMFRLFHKPVFIPWEEIRAVRDKQLLFAKLKELVIGDPAIAIMQIKLSTFYSMEQASPFKNLSGRNGLKPNF